MGYFDTENNRRKPRKTLKNPKLPSVADPGCLSRIRMFPSWIQGQKGTGSGFTTKNSSNLTQKFPLSSRHYDPGCFSRTRIPDPVVKKAPDPGSGYATQKNLLKPPSTSWWIFSSRHWRNRPVA
jgi:hypothetical protein